LIAEYFNITQVSFNTFDKPKGEVVTTLQLLCYKNSMSIVISSFILVFLAEFGDKTQLLTLMLIAHYRKPWPVLGGIFCGILVSQGLAVILGEYLHKNLPEEQMKYVVSIIFLVTGSWILWSSFKSEEDSEEKIPMYRSAFTSCFLAFSIAELGDKTQIATAALTVQSGQMWSVLIGAILAMIAMNGLTVIFGQALLKKVPLKAVRLFAAALCFLTAAVIFFAKENL